MQYRKKIFSLINYLITINNNILNKKKTKKKQTKNKPKKKKNEKNNTIYNFSKANLPSRNHRIYRFR